VLKNRDRDRVTISRDIHDECEKKHKPDNKTLAIIIFVIALLIAKLYFSGSGLGEKYKDK